MLKSFNFFKKKKNNETEKTNPANQWQQGNQIPNQRSQGSYPPNLWQQNNNNPNQRQQDGFYSGQRQQNMNQKPLVPCVCPRCGANLMIEGGLDTFFCQYCGCKIILQSEANLKTRFGLKKLEHTEKMADKVIGYFDKKNKQKAIQEEKKRKDSNIAAVIAVLFFVMVLIGCFFMIRNSKRESDAQEAALQEILEQAQIDITNGDYEAALIKASQLTITSDYSHSVKEKWDSIREQTITLINELRNPNQNEESTSAYVEETEESLVVGTKELTLPTNSSTSTSSVISSEILGDFEIIDDSELDSESSSTMLSDTDIKYDAYFRHSTNSGRGKDQEYIFVDFDNNVMTILHAKIRANGEIGYRNKRTLNIVSDDYSKGWQSVEWGDTAYYVWESEEEKSFVRKENHRHEKIQQYDEITIVPRAIKDLVGGLD